MQTITRKGSFDAAHRVMNEKMKCFNVHGHTYLYELEFRFDKMEEIGYQIDFKEIKRVGCQFIDDFLDHGVIVNSEDHILIKAAVELNSKIWTMGLTFGYCNPTAENLAKEIFLIQEILFADYPHLHINAVTLYETPNCYTRCTEESISTGEKSAFYGSRYQQIEEYKREKGVINYDDRVCP